MAFSKIILNGQTLMDVTKDTITASSALDGITAHNAAGNKITGSLGTVAQAIPSISVSSSGLITATSVQAAGVVESGTKTATQQLTTVAATTYNTSTTDQTIPSGRYTTGTQTIKAVTVSGLSAANIASGVTVKVGDANDDDRIASVTGTLTFVNYYTGSSTPSSSTGSNGDIYLKTVG